jgi:hypothetical protein
MAALAVAVFMCSQINPKAEICAVETRISDEIKQSEQRTKAANDELHHLITERLTISEHIEYKDRKDKDTARQDTLMAMLAQTRLAKEDETKDLANLNERMAGMRAEIAEIRLNITGSANIGKQFDALQAQILKQQDNFQTVILDMQRRIDARPPISLGDHK